MLKGIDHIVIVVRDLDAAVTDYGRLGFTVVRGGRHPSMGTHNALVAFSDGAYFELMAFTPPIADTLNWWYSALTIGGGLVDFCVQTTDLEADAEAFRKAGAEIAKSFRMGRERPDGYKLSWQIATTEGADRGVAPTASPACERSPSRCRTRPLPSRFIRACSEIPVNQSNARTLAVRAFALWWGRTNFSSSRR